jgi:hypothetical protein
LGSVVSGTASGHSGQPRTRRGQPLQSNNSNVIDGQLLEFSHRDRRIAYSVIGGSVSGIDYSATISKEE